jgi:hypothetical protein
VTTDRSCDESLPSIATDELSVERSSNRSSEKNVRSECYQSTSLSAAVDTLVTLYPEKNLPPFGG